MMKVAFLVGLFCVLSGLTSSSELVKRQTLGTLDASRLDVIDDKVRTFLNETLSVEAEETEREFNDTTDQYDAECESKVERIGAACVECAKSACQPQEVEEKQDIFKGLVSKLKDGIKKFARKIKDKVKKFARKIGRTVRKVWRGISRVVRRTVRRVIRGTVRGIKRTIRGVARVVRRVGRVIGRVARGVGRVIRRVGRLIRRIRIRFRLRRLWGKRNADRLPPCAMSCNDCRLLQSGDTNAICGENTAANDLLAELELIEEALEATHNGNVPVIAKIEFDRQKMANNATDMYFTDVSVTANIRGSPVTFKSDKPLPLFSDVSVFAEGVADQVWAQYQNSGPNPDVASVAK